MSWTDDRVDSLKRLWLDGLSASQIANQLGGGVTRNAVIGKVHRLGLSGRAAPSQPARATPKPVRPHRPAAVAMPVRRHEPAAVAPSPSLGRAVVEEVGSATVLTLGAHMCKWPIGDPSTDTFAFCGRRTGDEGPYCETHAAVAYQPPQKRTKTGEIRELTRSLRRYI